MRRRTPQQAMGFALFIAAISFWNFSRLTGCDCIRTIHIITLLTSGAGIGIFLTNLIAWLKNKDTNSNKDV